jgi:transposase
MKEKTEKTVSTTIATRKPWGRLNEEIKSKIISEISSGLLSERAAGRKYGLPKSTIGKWHDKHNLANLLSPQIPDGHLAMDESKESKLLKKKIEELTKALSDAQLKNVALETMIEVAESELKIKIRKKRGTKQS